MYAIRYRLWLIGWVGFTRRCRGRRTGLRWSRCRVGIWGSMCYTWPWLDNCRWIYLRDRGSRRWGWGLDRCCRRGRCLQDASRCLCRSSSPSRLRCSTMVNRWTWIMRGFWGLGRGYVPQIGACRSRRWLFRWNRRIRRDDGLSRQ